MMNLLFTRTENRHSDEFMLAEEVSTPSCSSSDQLLGYKRLKTVSAMGQLIVASTEEVFGSLALHRDVVLEDTDFLPWGGSSFEKVKVVRKMEVSWKLLSVFLLSSCVLGSNNRFPNHRNVNYKIIASAAEDAPAVSTPARSEGALYEAPKNNGYLYQTPKTGIDVSQTQFSLSTQAGVSQSIKASASQVNFSADASALAAEKILNQAESKHNAVHLTDIQVQCGKDRMMVAVTFDGPFNGVIYAKNHYNDPECRYVSADSRQSEYMFAMRTEKCGVEFIDSGLKEGGQAYVKALLVILYEAGVQEAWDAAREIRCLWEGNIEQTVTYPFNVNMLDLQRIDFNGDTASASLEIQVGAGPRGQPVQGLVRIGEQLTAVVKVVGDPDFDVFVHDCIATDGTPNNKIQLTDRDGCAVKTKLMGGWTKQKISGSVYAYAKMSAFKFPDVMQMYLECAVSLCKGQCDECSKFEDLHDPSHHHEDSASSTSALEPAVGRKRRNVAHHNHTEPEESLLLRKVVNVIGPDDIPDLYPATGVLPSHRSGEDNATTECFSLMTIMAGTFIAILLIISTILIMTMIKRTKQPSFESSSKYYSPTRA